MLNQQYRRIFVVFIALSVVGAFLVGPNSAKAETYSGQATASVQIVNVYGQIVGTQTYTTNVEVIIDPPRSGETNPFSLVIQSTPLVNNSGEFSIHSSLPVQGVLFQYWTYQSQNGMLEGILTDNHVSEAIALNLITIPTEIAPNLWMPLPLAMANDTRMTGSLNQNQVQFQVIGNTTDMAHPFQIDIIVNPI